MKNAAITNLTTCTRFNIIQNTLMCLFLFSLGLLTACTEFTEKFKTTRPAINLFNSNEQEANFKQSYPDLCTFDYRDQKHLKRSIQNNKVLLLDEMVVARNDMLAIEYLSDARTKYSRYHPLGNVALATPMFMDEQADQGSHPIWPLVRAEFKLKQNTNARYFAEEINWYKKNSNYLNRAFNRGNPYLYFILEEIKKRQLPGELILIPVIESAYDPFAYSPGGAAGMWQFVPGTARRFGLKQNRWYDGRRDVVASTRAALDYLQTMNREFNGNWLYTLAAYNAGSGTVSRAIESNKRRGRSSDFWSLPLPRHTQHYVTRLLALSKIIDTPSVYGISLPHVPSTAQVTLVSLNGQIDLAKAATLANMSLNELYRLNPGFNRWASDPNGPYYLLVPQQKADVFKGKLATRTPQQALRSGAGQTQNSRSKQIVHRVKQGEGLWTIARLYGVKTQQLAQWNDLSANASLKTGQTLSVWPTP